jgi:predicted ArsR family transcriptional regulator
MTADSPGIEAWTEQASAFDRVRSVADTLARPRSASYVAEQASVAENTARDHLERLVEMNVLLRETREGTTLYAPDPLHTRAQALRDLLEEHDHDELVGLKAALQERIEAWRDEYGVDSPAALRARAADTDDAAATREIREAASDWELVAYRLGLVETAIEQYAAYSRDHPARA